MSRSRYTGAHAAKPEAGAPAQEAEPPKPRVRKKAPRPEPPPETAVPPLPRRRLSRRMVFFLAAVAAALLLGLIAILLQRPLGEGIYEESMEKAIAAYEREDMDNALRYLRRAAAHEESDECLLLMAACYEKQDNLDKALELLRMVDPADERASNEILKIEEQKSRLKSEEAVNVLGQLLPPDTTDLVLDRRGLTDLNLEEVAQLYALDSLSLAGNPLTDLSPLVMLESLDVLDLSGCRVSDLNPLQQMTGLRSLYLDRNPLTDLSPLYALQNLSLLSIRGCGVTEEELNALAAQLPACAILSDTDEEDVSNISLGGLTFRSDVEELDLSGRGIRDISVLAACKELKKLNLSGNEISDLQGLMNLPQLARLDVSANQLSDLRPLIGLETLRSLNAAGNALLDTSALSAMSALQTLDLSDNPITDFSGLRQLVNLTALRLGNTGLTDADLYYLTGLTLLTQLTIDDNPALSNEAFGRLRSSLPDCTISHSELVYSIPIGELTVPSNIVELDLSGQGLEDLNGIERLNHLERLNLSRNQISNLYAMKLSASRSILRELNLAFNQIEDLSDLKGLSALESLNLFGNPLSGTQTLLGMSGLRRLNVGGCGLSEEQLSQLREALPECEIVLEYE